MNRHVFQHEAMATYFEITVAGQTRNYARQAAAAAFRELDRLESELSRYIESSDIARANRLARGQAIPIGDDAFECLLQAAAVAVTTNRAFDPSYGTERAPDLPAGHPPFTLDPETHSLTSHATRLALDLGAIGKGYALDRLAETLREWSVNSALLNSGGSSVLALDPPPEERGWPATFGGDGPYRQFLPLAHGALAASGLSVKGLHLVDPRTRTPAGRTTRTWALAHCAAAADALSTAFFVWNDEEVTMFCTAHPETGAAYFDASGKLVVRGALLEVAPAIPAAGPGDDRTSL